MKVLVVSDSHGLKNELFQILNEQQQLVDLIVHCGDSELHKSDFSNIKNIIIVGGNCDYDRNYATEIIQQYNELNIFVTHGHLHNVKISLVKLTYRAEELRANLVCFGHSHVATAFVENNVLYVNPGSIHLPKNRIEKSYAIVEYQNKGTATVTFYDQSNNEITDLKQSFHLV